MTAVTQEDKWYWRVDSQRKPDRSGKRKGKTRLKYNWDEIRKHIDEQLKTLAERDIKPTIRKLYYILSNLEGEGVILPSVKKAYQRLSEYMKLKYASLCSSNTCIFFTHTTSFLELILFIKSFLRMY